MYFFTVVFFRDADGGMGLLGMGLLINGMVQAWVGQKLLKRDILRVFMMSDS